MTCIDSRINELYGNLCKIMRHPQDFGLGQRIPEPLANALEGVLCTLNQIQMEQALDEKGDLAAELSQDADSPSSERSASGNHGGQGQRSLPEIGRRPVQRTRMG
jgi:hypothetical protein